MPLAEYEAAWDEEIERAKQAVAEQHDEVVELGGLYVLGTERHESRRIDNQLRGRSGRQGDPGESRFYLSLTDELMRNFNPGVAQRIMNSPSIPDDMALEFGFVSKAIQNAQAQVEGRNAEQRKNVLKYDDVMNRQREVIYTERRKVLEGADLAEVARDLTVEDIGDHLYTKGQPDPDLVIRTSGEQRLGGRRTAWDVDVDRHHPVAAAHHRVAEVVISTTVGAGSHGDDVARLGHLVVDLAQHRRHLLTDPARDDHQVRLPG